MMETYETGQPWVIYRYGRWGVSTRRASGER